MRSAAIIICCLIIFAAFGLWMENSPLFDTERQVVHSKSVPTAILSYGSMGKLLTRLGLIKAVENDYAVFKPSENGSAQKNTNGFQKKRQVGKYLYHANSGGMKNMPSSLVISDENFVPGWPLISIVVDDDSLYSPETGIVTNYNGRGQQWERLAYVSYYEDGKLLFATSAGLRLHGGRSRRPATKEELANRLILPENARKKNSSFRLYFRDDYGMNHIQPGVIFADQTTPIKTLVVRYEKSRAWPFRICMSHDIVNRIGGIAPPAKPAILYLNGQLRGPYFVCEHISKRQWARHFEHEDFAFYRYKGKSDAESEKVYQKMLRWGMDTRKRLTLEDAKKVIDVENLSCFMLSLAFCGTDDGFQGAAMLDTSRDDAKWFWLNWDMDATGWHGKLERESWEKTLPTKYRSGIQAILFKRLLTECPQYRAYFARLVTDRLNHRIDVDFLNQRVEYYDRLAIDYGLDKALLGERHFFDRRGDYVRDQMAEFPFFGVPENFACQVKGPSGTKYIIDGYPKEKPYRGRYFKTMPITVEIAESPPDRRFAHWLINGRKVTDPRLVYAIQSDTVIEAVFE